MPRTEKSFVRQLALCGPLEDSVVRCCSGAHSTDGENKEDLLYGDIPGRMAHGGLMEDPRRGTQPCSRTDESKLGSPTNPGSGVKCLSIKVSNGRSSLCLLSPVGVSPSPSFMCLDEEEKHGPGDSNAFCTSPELFSAEEEEDLPHTSVKDLLMEEAAMLDESPSSGFLKRNSSDKWNYFRRRTFQPVVKLHPDAVVEYLERQMEKCPWGARRVHKTEVGTLILPLRDMSLRQMQPVVQLDRHSVTKYFQDKNLSKTRNVEPRLRIFGTDLTSLTLETGMKTPLVISSMPKSRIQNSAAPQETTGRKVCISGFSVKRWGNRRKKSTKAQKQLSFQDYGDMSLFRDKEDVGGALSPLHFSPSLLTSSFLNSTTVGNLDLSTESFSIRDTHKDLQRWARLRAALSLHRKKKVEAGLPSLHLADRRTGNQSAHSNSSSLLLLSPSSLYCDDLTDAEKVLAECQQEKPISFHQCLTQDQILLCQKVGEGVYGEVFRTVRGDQLVALKIIPIEGSQKVNGEPQKSFAEILPEIIISKELSLLSGGENNRTSGFINLHSAYCVKGSYPPELLAAWDEFAEEKGTENERPDLFGEEQLFMILEFEFGGDDLERMSSKLPSVSASRSILHQVTAALAVAEEELRFEHRDLHWGNLLIETCSARTLPASLQGKIFHIPSAGVQVKIIDYTLSRLDKDGLTVFCDLSMDEDLFLGEGDVQFDVYRNMREENQNGWSLYKPHSNVLWLHYLCDKLLNEVRYVRKPASHQKELRKLRDFRREVRQFTSAADVLQRSKLFK
ncbi:serine/threonine-protein kinase haspin [Rana temporaria]|uniref:serine/threonine-protein kinase haspin n=1 Tax=Rana temporaria TaxID=8407 RepID=UPI001AAC84BB|nr:serine/threonine-protein kinase haspin [Rana temporaria]